jgi:hypothetical protein
LAASIDERDLGEAWQSAADAAEEAANEAAEDAEGFIEETAQFVESLAESGTEIAGQVLDAVAGWFGPYSGLQSG